MNKRRVEALLPLALQTLEHSECGMQKSTGEIESGYRAQISAFGAAVTMGSFKAAVAFFSKAASNRANENSTVDRSKLLRAMYYIVQYKTKEDGKPDTEANNENWKDAKVIAAELLRLPDSAVSQTKEEFINASLALKLALNAYSLT